MFNKYREVFSSWEAFLGWKQLEEDSLHMPVSSSLRAMTKGYRGCCANIN